MSNTPTATANDGVISLSVSPLLRWCGNKFSAPITQILAEEYMKHCALFPESYYIAPFAGALGDLYKIMPEKVFAGDVNRPLINMYQWIQDGCEYQNESIWHDISHDLTYANVRKRFNAVHQLIGRYLDAIELTANDFRIVNDNVFNPTVVSLGHEIIAWPETQLADAIANEQEGELDDTDVSILVNFFEMLQAQASMDLIWLNRTGFNGLYRVNKGGNFNTPIGRDKVRDPKQPGILNLEHHTSLYKHWEFTCCDYRGIGQDFTDTFGEPFTGQFIYCDPLYAGGEQIYSPNTMDYELLADTLAEWAFNGNTVAVSNHYTTEMVAILTSRGFDMIETSFRQNVARDSHARKSTPEILGIIRATL